MKILGLFNNSCAVELFDWLELRGNEVVRYNEILSLEWCRLQRFELTVSYTYRHILTEEVLEALGGNVVNIHNSYLPWNRGADPNIWSILEGTPRGVTLHYMNAGLDKGDIIAQKLLGKAEAGTLQSSYDDLDQAAKELFKDAFVFYEEWPQMKKISLGGGSYHSVKDGEKIKRAIDSYDITIAEFREKMSLFINK